MRELDDNKGKKKTGGQEKQTARFPLSPEHAGESHVKKKVLGARQHFHTLHLGNVWCFISHTLSTALNKRKQTKKSQVCSCTRSEAQRKHGSDIK